MRGKWTYCDGTISLELRLFKDNVKYLNILRIHHSQLDNQQLSCQHVHLLNVSHITAMLNY